MRVKYPRTPHLPWSEGVTDDDVKLKGLHDHLLFEPVVVTEKMDGECTTIYPDGHTHARSMDSMHHVSRSWVKQYAAIMAHNMKPDTWIVGENMFAQHSIAYDDLESYFLGFALFGKSSLGPGWEYVESWAETEREFARLNIATPPVIYKGEFDRDKIHKAWEAHTAGRVSEGYVVRCQLAFHVGDFKNDVAKYVRKNHVQTDEHWTSKPVVANGLK